MQLDFSDFTATQRYHLMTQTIIPRPIAWALTDSDNGSYNLAPFSYFTAVSSEPALLMLSVGKKGNGDNKDTLTNIINNKKLVIHIASTKHAERVTQTAETLAHGESELANINLTTTHFENFSLPRLAECDIAFGCELYEIKQLGDAAQTLIFVEIKQLYMHERITAKDIKGRLTIDASIVAPLARLGGGEYASITEPFTLQRPQ
jgi:flavin reductase (DIM6/NTAB) family NADH-FMN oxidoreductase RutF